MNEERDLVVMERATYDMLRKTVFDAHLEIAQLRAKLTAAPLLDVQVTSGKPVPARKTRTTAVLPSCPYCNGKPQYTEPHKQHDGVVVQHFTCGHKRNVWPK